MSTLIATRKKVSYGKKIDDLTGLDTISNALLNRYGTH